MTCRTGCRQNLDNQSANQPIQTNTAQCYAHWIQLDRILFRSLVYLVRGIPQLDLLGPSVIFYSRTIRLGILPLSEISNINLSFATCVALIIWYLILKDSVSWSNTLHYIWLFHSVEFADLGKGLGISLVIFHYHPKICFKINFLMNCWNVNF